MKPGFQSSEFLGVGAACAVLLQLAMSEGAPPLVRGCAAIGAAIASTGYAISRGLAKAAEERRAA